MTSPSGAALVRYGDGVSYVLAAALRIKHAQNLLYMLTPEEVSRAAAAMSDRSGMQQPKPLRTELTSQIAVSVVFREDTLKPSRDGGTASTFTRLVEEHTPSDSWGLLMMGPVGHRRWDSDAQNFGWVIEPLTEQWQSAGKDGAWLTGQTSLPLAPSAKQLAEMLPSAWSMTADLLAVFGGVDRDALPVYESTPRPIGLEAILQSEMEYRAKIAADRATRMEAVKTAKSVAAEIRRRPFKIVDDPALAELLSAIRTKR